MSQCGLWYPAAWTQLEDKLGLDTESENSGGQFDDWLLHKGDLEVFLWGLLLRCYNPKNLKLAQIQMYTDRATETKWKEKNLGFSSDRRQRSIFFPLFIAEQ